MLGAGTTLAPEEDLELRSAHPSANSSLRGAAHTCEKMHHSVV
jgi:hypothetical protein